MTTPRVLLPLLLTTSLAASGFELINVNFNGFTGGNPGPTQDASTLEGPAGGLGTSWNQYAANSSSGVMVDATGAATTVTVTTNFAEGRYDGTAPSLTMLRAALTDFGRGLTRTVTISGLTPNAHYDVWLVSHRHQNDTRERQKGTWTTELPTVSPKPQLVDGTGWPSSAPLNGSSFVAGVNFASFLSVEANASGVITFTGKGATVADGYEDDFRLHLNGIQIAPAAPVIPPEPLEITEIIRNNETDEITLTWKSNVGEIYGLYWSDDLDGFVLDGTHHAIPAAAEGNRTTLGPIANPLPGADKLFFKIGPPDLSTPALLDSFGSGNTVTLRFSEEIHPDSVDNLANFTVTVGGVPITVVSATLAPGGRSILLTLDGSLAPDTQFSVIAENITTLAGRVIPAAFEDSFRTFDDDPDGVQVFILAGQSNMQGHGRVETGNGGVAGAIGSLRYLAVNDASYPDVDYSRLLVDPTQPTTSPWNARSDVKIWWDDRELNASPSIRKGNLTNTFGTNTSWIGPEYGFGWALGEHFSDKPVLIIKSAWGGKSLHVDFRSPSAVANRGGVIGPYYTAMLDHVRECLSNLGTEFPEFAGIGYRIAGFGWHQGWNDRGTPAFFNAYEANLVDLINDLRAELGSPALPVSITTTGMAPTPQYTAVELAQLAVANPALYPDFADNVKTTDTRPFWREASVSPLDQGFHWNGNAESQYLNGTAMGQQMIEMLEP